MLLAEPIQYNNLGHEASNLCVSIPNDLRFYPERSEGTLLFRTPFALNDFDLGLPSAAPKQNHGSAGIPS